MYQIRHKSMNYSEQLFFMWILVYPMQKGLFKKNK